MEEIKELYNVFHKFLSGYQKIYIKDDPEKISRARLCVFQLIHVPRHIEWNGSIRFGSQATVERTIGKIGHRIHSKKAPFAHMANIIYERELVKLLLLYYPSLNPLSEKSFKRGFIQKVRIQKAERGIDQELYHHLQAICLWLKRAFDNEIEAERYGKFQIPGGGVLQSKLSEDQGKPSTRSSCYFEAVKDGQLVFGKALAFFDVVQHTQQLVVYQPLEQVTKVLTAIRGKWSINIAVLPVAALCNHIGILPLGQNVFILRKHPGLAWLSDEEKGIDSNEEGEDLIGDDQAL